MKFKYEAQKKTLLIFVMHNYKLIYMKVYFEK